MARLFIKNLTVSNGEREIVKGVSLVVSPCSLTALLGSSGSGKSTLLKAVNRIHDENNIFYRGSILLDGEDILSRKSRLWQIRKRIGMVFQTPAPFPVSIEKNISYAIALHEKLSKRQMSERVQEALWQANLLEEVKDRLSQSAMSLSGGQRQRLCIARALAVRPQVLLLDEPTSALDPLSALKIEELMLSLKQSMTLVLVTHSVEQAKRCADFAAIMQDGRLCESGCASAVLYSPKSEGGKKLIL